MDPIWFDRIAVLRELQVRNSSVWVNMQTRQNAAQSHPRSANLFQVVNFQDLSYEQGSGLYCYCGRPFTGAAIQLFPTGELESVGQCVEGLEHGVSAVWHREGKIAIYNEMCEGVTNGLYIEWDENGTKLVEEDNSILNGH